MCVAKGKRQRTAAVQNLAAVRLGLENAKRLGLRQSSAAFVGNLVADTLNCTPGFSGSLKIRAEWAIVWPIVSLRLGDSVDVIHCKIVIGLRSPVTAAVGRGADSGFVQHRSSHQWRSSR